MSHRDEQRGRVLSRRELLGVAGTAGVGVLASGRPGFARNVLPGSLGCVARPAQMEGPYFVDEQLQRSDIRADPADGSVSEGAPLSLRLVVHRIDTGCVPLPGAHVDLWQCDAAGVYSGVTDARVGFDTRGKKFLRGYQVTDEQGAVEFRSIYPGWYAGRTPHLHFKVRVFEGDRRAYEFTSQLYFDDALTDRVHAHEPYAARGPRDTRNAQDGIFRGGGTGAQLMLDLQEREGGYAGTFEVGLLMA